MVQKVKLKDVVMRVKDKIDKDTTDLEFYVGGEHIDSGEISITKKGRIEGSTIGPAFHMHFMPGDVLLMSRNPHLKKAGVVDFEGICSDVSYICRTKDENVLSQQYLPFIFQTDHFWQFVEENKKGGLPFFLNWSDFEKYEFMLPDIDKQNEMANILWAAQNTKLAYIELLKQTDELVKSQFIEMSEHADGRPTRMGDIATYINGAAFKPKDWSPVGKPIIRIQNLNDPLASYNYFAGTIDEKYLVHPGEVLVSWATHLEAYVWNGEEAWLNQHIFRTVFDKKDVNRTFFIYAANVALKEAFKKAHGFKKTMEHIKRGDFEDAIVYLPDKTTQELFAAFAEQADKSKFDGANRNLSRCSGTRM